LKEELEPEERCVEAMQANNRHNPADKNSRGCYLNVMVAFDGRDKERKVLLGGIVFEYYFPSNTAIITYLVTNPNVRGQGSAIFLGINAWGVMQQQSQRHGHPHPHVIFCEVNDPSLISDSEDAISPLSRLRAFQQMGVRQMERFSYVQPALQGQTERARDMLLAVVVGPMTPRDEATGSSYVDSAHVRAFLEDFYTDLCPELLNHPQGLASDKDYAAMLKCLEGRPRILLKDFDLSRFKPATKRKPQPAAVEGALTQRTGGAAPSVPVHIVIVGSGLSGLACARGLRDAGFHVTILEGRNRIGGRIYTGRSYDTRIDLGAAWLHGLEGNPLAELALARLPSLKLYKNNEQAIVLFDRQGKQMDASAVFEGYMKFVQLLDTLQSEFNPQELDRDDEGPQGYEAWKRTQPKVQQSLQDAITQLYAKHSKLHYTNEQDKVVMQFMFSQLESLQGASMFNLNARDYDHGIQYEGGDNIVVSGFQNITKMLSADLDCPIRLGHKVDRIEWQPKKGDEVPPPAPSAAEADSSKAPKATLSTLPKVRVHVTLDGETSGSAAPIDCHGVVVTSSIGVLKSRMTSFVPSLPPWKESSIEHVGSGLFNKVVLRFDKVFWPESADYIGFNFPAPGQEGATDASLDAAHAVRSNSWFVNYAPVAKVPILIAMLTGPLAEAMEKLPDAAVVAEMMRRLRVMFGDAVPSAPSDVLITRWGADPYSLGSYSYLKKGGSIVDHEHIGAPVGNSIFWAGEHTSLDRFGYADGAYVSGLREAQRIIDLYQHLREQPKAKL